jgi:putative ABC transport system substrate-binding protein
VNHGFPTRRFVLATATVAPLLPRAIRAQEPGHFHRIGALFPFSENDPVGHPLMAAFSQALERLGWIKGKNVRFEYRFAADSPALFSNYAAELVGLSPDVILANTPPAVLPLQQQRHTIPIVFLFVIDPVGLGLVQSLARPGGNLTGFGAFDPPVLGKWLEFLKDIAPTVTRGRRPLQSTDAALRGFPLPRHRARRRVRRGRGDAGSSER